MRQQQNAKSKKENLTLTIGKKKRGRKSIRSSSNRNHRVTMENLECISDALHFHAYGVQGAWKLVPKDSCEVYKDQRKKQNHSRSGKEKKPTRLNNKKRPERKGPKRHEPPSSDRSLSDKDEDSRHNKEKTPRSPKKVKKAPRRRKKNRPSSDESVSSYSTCSRTSVSTPSSDMEH